jgi:NarL family two-component system sensor histidine kinase LiaS
MNYRGTFGIQWRLTAHVAAAVLLVTAAGAAGAAAAHALGADFAAALGAGALAALGTGSAVVVTAFRYTHGLKLRLWDAADLAEHVARGDYAVRLAADGGDDVAALETELNRMADSLALVVGALQSRAEQNRRLAEEAGRGAALEERARLARDLHDTVNQQLFALALRLAAAARELAKLGAPAAPLVAELQALEAMSRQAHAETRGLILQLRPTTLEQNGLAAALAEYAARAAAQEGWALTTRGLDAAPALHGAGAEVLFRVAQEALHNAAKHAAARAVEVTLGVGNGIINLSVADDGRGFDPRKPLGPASFGLLGMRERLAALGGSLTVTSRAPGGTTVTAALPAGTA